MRTDYPFHYYRAKCLEVIPIDDFYFLKFQNHVTIWVCCLLHIVLRYWSLFTEVIVITTKEIHKMMSTDPKMKLEPIKMKLDVVCIQEDGDMGTADALRHIQQKIKVCGDLEPAS